MTDSPEKPLRGNGRALSDWMDDKHDVPWFLEWVMACHNEDIIKDPTLAPAVMLIALHFHKWLDQCEGYVCKRHQVTLFEERFLWISRRTEFGIWDWLERWTDEARSGGGEGWWDEWLDEYCDAVKAMMGVSYD